MGVKVKVNFNSKDIEKKIRDVAYAKASSQNYNIECPHCKSSVSVPPGKSICPFCGKEIHLKLNIKF